jgi:hypothetical protein
MKRWFALHCSPLRLALRVLNRSIRTRQPITVSICERCGARARMPDAHARPARSSQEPGTGPPSLVYERHPRRPFRYTAHASGVTGYRMVFAHSNRSGWRMILGAVSGINCSSLRSSTGKDRQPGFTEPTLALGRGQAQAPNHSARAKYRHCSARALAGLASFADRSTPLPRSANNGGALSLRSNGRKQTRPASDRAHQKKHQQDVARLRPT